MLSSAAAASLRFFLDPPFSHHLFLVTWWFQLTQVKKNMRKSNGIISPIFGVKIKDLLFQILVAPPEVTRIPTPSTPLAPPCPASPPGHQVLEVLPMARPAPLPTSVVPAGYLVVVRVRYCGSWEVCNRAGARHPIFTSMQVLWMSTFWISTPHLEDAVHTTILTRNFSIHRLSVFQYTS